MRDNMSKTSKKQANQKTLVILSLIFVIAILITLLSGFISLVIDPGNRVVVEKRKNIPRRNDIWIHN